MHDDRIERSEWMKNLLQIQYTDWIDAVHCVANPKRNFWTKSN